MTQAKVWFDRVHIHYVQQHMYLIRNLGKLLKGIERKCNIDLRGAATQLEDMKTWRDFMPSIQNNLVTLTEVYLSMVFNETLSSMEGRKAPYKDRFFMFKNRAKLTSLQNTYGLDRSIVKRGFSFQRLDATKYLFKKVLNINLAKYPRWKEVTIIFEKRHLFVHQAGLIDRKFRNRYNSFHKSNADRKIPLASLGSITYLEVEWVEDAEQVILGLINFIEENI